MRSASPDRHDLDKRNGQAYQGFLGPNQLPKKLGRELLIRFEREHVQAKSQRIRRTITRQGDRKY